MSAAANRREALRRAALAGGALAAAGLPALMRAPAAIAQADEEDEDLRDFLEPAIEHAQNAEFAFREAGDARRLDAKTKRLFERFRDQEAAHAEALRNAIDSLGFDPPDPPADSGSAAELRPLATAKDGKDALEFLIELTEAQIRFYLDEAPKLESNDMLTTSLEIAANEAQHLVALRETAGLEPAEAAEVPTGGGKSGGSGS